MKKAVVIHSGGLDSTVLLYAMQAKGYEVISLGVDYGQRHKVELRHALHQCARIGVERHTLDLSALRPFLAGSSQTDDSVPVPEGHYTHSSMKLTVVPNRNMIMLAAAAGFAISRKAQVLAYGAHSGDHAIYPDCRAEFVEAMKHALKLADWHKLKLVAPFVKKTKAEIVKQGAKLGVPFSLTWSCYKADSEKHCGKCGTCVERREAFELAKVADPTEYRL